MGFFATYVAMYVGSGSDPNRPFARFTGVPQEDSHEQNPAFGRRRDADRRAGVRPIQFHVRLVFQGRGHQRPHRRRQRQARQTHGASPHLSKTEAQKNAEEAETTRQLNQDESQYAANTSTAVPGSMDVRTAGGNSPSNGNMSSDPNRPRNGMGRITGANSGVEGRIGGSNSNGPAPQ